MLIIERDGSIEQANLGKQPGQEQAYQAYIELTVQPGADLSASIEQILDLAFDQLKLSVLDLRIKQPDND